MITLIGIIIGIIVGILIEALAVWGIGLFALWAFGATTTFTFWMALALTLVINVLISSIKVIVKND